MAAAEHLDVTLGCCRKSSKTHLGGRSLNGTVLPGAIRDTNWSPIRKILTSDLSLRTIYFPYRSKISLGVGVDAWQLVQGLVQIPVTDF